MHDPHALISSRGALSQQILVEMVAFLRKIPRIGKVSKRLVAILVEMSQNIMHYSAQRDRDAETGRTIGVGIVSVVESDRQYQVRAGNLARRESCDALKELCSAINDCSEADLRLKSKLQRKTSVGGDKKGAGLGLYEISLKSDTQLQCAVRDIDQTHSFIELSTAINKQDAP